MDKNYKVCITHRQSGRFIMAFITLAWLVGMGLAIFLSLEGEITLWKSSNRLVSAGICAGAVAVLFIFFYITMQRWKYTEYRYDGMIYVKRFGGTISKTHVADTEYKMIKPYYDGNTCYPGGIAIKDKETGRTIDVFHRSSKGIKNLQEVLDYLKRCENIRGAEDWSNE